MSVCVCVCVYPAYVCQAALRMVCVCECVCDPVQLKSTKGDEMR